MPKIKLLDAGELDIFHRYVAMTSEVIGAIRQKLDAEYPDELAAVNAALHGGARVAIVTRAGPPASVALAVTGMDDRGEEITIEAFKWVSLDLPRRAN